MQYIILTFGRSVNLGKSEFIMLLMSPLPNKAVGRKLESFKIKYEVI